jgi:oligoribonuclease (3'-5' exoribonuclease)
MRRKDGESGLTAAVLASTVTSQQAADGLLDYIQRYVPDRGVALLYAIACPTVFPFCGSHYAF